jgi:hypothetical protein
VRSNGDPAITTLLHDAGKRLATQYGKYFHANPGLTSLDVRFRTMDKFPDAVQLLTIAGPNRVLHVRVDTRQDPQAAMGSIGHELQHAIEALSESGVRTNALMHAFFERVSGSPSASGQLQFETDAAVKAGDAVRAELHVHR